ncbi:S26 family signal peptidase [Rhizobium binae]|uniref:S26 family signal peptidase n=1 Tax=Rhizobium binae TaxID=1138190 RepID=UPI001C82E580|nr:S26 family signal peptidase [Rhizobium binae]MBX4952709.1 S26 family signal peptidase [Rhizobium binae]
MKRFAWVIATYVSALFTTGLVFFHPQKKFIWNASASAPIGLYRIEPVEQLDVTDLAVVMPSDALASFLEQRGYLPKGVPLLKRVLAVSGTEVCRHDKAISAYDIVYGEALDRDSRGRPLPVWEGCITIEKGQAFFMNWDVPESLDGRYFGALPLSSVVGRAVPLWTYDDPPISPPSTQERQRP